MSINRVFENSGIPSERVLSMTILHEDEEEERSWGCDAEVRLQPVMLASHKALVRVLAVLFLV